MPYWPISTYDIPVSQKCTLGIFWPGMTNAVELMISRCVECTACLPLQTLEPQIAIEATRPFKRFSIDLGTQKGKGYLIGMDRYSGWPMAAAPIPKKADKKKSLRIS